MKLLLTPMAAAVAVALSLPAVAEQILTVDTIVVSGSRSAEDLLDEASSISVIKPDAKIAADNVPDLIKDVGSVNLVSDGTPGVKRISIRGENASRTLLLVDGQRIDDAKTKSGAPLLINPFFIDHVEVLKGPSSVLYGSDAMGGIVHVITKQASEEPFAAQGGAAYCGSGNGFAEYLNLSGTLGDFSYVLGGFNTDMGDMYLSGHDRVDNTSYYSKGLNAHLSYLLTPDSLLSFTSEYFNVNAFTASTTDDPVYRDFKAHIPKWQRVKNALSLELNDINEYLAKVSLSAYVQDNDKDFSSTMQSRSLEVGVENEQHTYGGNLQFELALSEMFYLTLGYDGRVDELCADSSATFSSMNVSYSDDDYQQTTHALYALLETYLTDTLTLDTGVRWNYVETEVGSSTLPSFMLAQGGTGSFSNTRVVGSAGLVWHAIDNGALRLNWSQGFRVPNIQELYLTTFTGEMQLGNPELDPETSNNYELGFRYAGSALTADAALFYTKAENYIETYRLASSELPPYLAGMLAYSYRNIASAESYGAELSLAYAFDYLTPYLDVTLMERKYDTGTETSTHTGTPKLKGRAGLRYADSYLNLPYYADVYTRFATRSRNDNLDGASYFDNTDFAGYMTLNLQLGISCGDKQQWNFYAGIDNIFDKDYQTTELIKEPGRFFSVGVSAAF